MQSGWPTREKQTGASLSDLRWWVIWSTAIGGLAKRQCAARQSFNTAPLGIGHRAWRDTVSGGSSRHATSRLASLANYCTVRAGRRTNQLCRRRAASGLFPVSECRQASRPASWYGLAHRGKCPSAFCHGDDSAATINSRPRQSSPELVRCCRRVDKQRNGIADWTVWNFSFKNISNLKKPALKRVQKPTPGKTRRQADARKWRRENPVSLALLVRSDIAVGKTQRGSNSGNILLCLETNTDGVTLTFWPQNKWVSRTRPGTFVSSLVLHRFLGYHLDKQTAVKTLPLRLQSASVTSDLPSLNWVFFWSNRRNPNDGLFAQVVFCTQLLLQGVQKRDIFR